MHILCSISYISSLSYNTYIIHRVIRQAVVEAGLKMIGVVVIHPGHLHHPHPHRLGMRSHPPHGRVVDLPVHTHQASLVNGRAVNVALIVVVEKMIHGGVVDGRRRRRRLPSLRLPALHHSVQSLLRHPHQNRVTIHPLMPTMVTLNEFQIQFLVMVLLFSMALYIMPFVITMKIVPSKIVKIVKVP